MALSHDARLGAELRSGASAKLVTGVGGVVVVEEGTPAGVEGPVGSVLGVALLVKERLAMVLR